MLLEWTKVSPTQPGIYWMSYAGTDKDAEVVRLGYSKTNLPRKLRAYTTQDPPLAILVEDVPWMSWYGPLYPPDRLPIKEKAP